MKTLVILELGTKASYKRVTGLLKKFLPKRDYSSLSIKIPNVTVKLINCIRKKKL